jgi:hypothetical protein
MLIFLLLFVQVYVQFPSDDGNMTEINMELTTSYRKKVCVTVYTNNL